MGVVSNKINIMELMKSGGGGDPTIPGRVSTLENEMSGVYASINQISTVELPKVYSSISEISTVELPKVYSSINEISTVELPKVYSSISAVSDLILEPVTGLEDRVEALEQGGGGGGTMTKIDEYFNVPASSGNPAYDVHLNGYKNDKIALVFLSIQVLGAVLINENLGDITYSMLTGAGINIDFSMYSDDPEFSIIAYTFNNTKGLDLKFRFNNSTDFRIRPQAITALSNNDKFAVENLLLFITT